MIKSSHDEFMTVLQPTDAGPLPLDWKAVSFRNVVHKYMDYRGRTPKKLGLDWGGEIVALSANNVQMGFIDFDKESYLGSDALYAKWMTGGDCELGDVLLTMEAPLGNIAQIPDRQRYILSQRVVLVRPISEVDKDFLAHQMRGTRFQQELIKNASGSTAQGIQRARLDDIPIAIPPATQEQREVAAALNDADALIDSLEQLLTKKRQIKQGVMQELLTGKRRLPGFSQAWALVRLGDIGRTYGGLTGKSKSDFGHGAAKYVTFMNVMTHVRMSPDAVGSVNIDPSESQNMVQPGDLLFNGSSETPEEVAFCSWVKSCEEGLFLNSFCFGFRPTVPDRISGLFMAYFFRARPGRIAVSSLAQGAIRYNIAKTALLQAPLKLPGFEEQMAIAETLSSMDDELTALESRLAKARALKQAMAQALLTGRVRLVEANA